MSDPVLVALISAIGLILSGVWVELIRTRKHAATAADQVTPNHGSSMRDIVTRIEADMRELRGEVHQNTVHLAKVEARFSEHLISTARRRSTDV